VGREIDNAFKVQAKGRIPDWAEPMIEYGKAVEWMRRQHWKNNRNKGELALGIGESAASMSRVADDRPGVAPSVGGTRARDGDGDGDRAGTGPGAPGF
jgi:hypothetical protein